jgi:glycosyltransferase involved in cell wall biosynthesis
VGGAAVRLAAVAPLASVAGGEAMLLRLLPELRSRRWDVVASVPGRGELEERLRREGVPVVRLPLGPPARRKPVAALAGAARAVRVAGAADIVLLNGLSAQRVLHAVRLRRRPAVLHVNNPIVGGVPAWSRPWTWSVVRAVIADSAACARECVDAGAPVERVHPLHPPAWGGVMEPRAAPLDGPGRVGFVGRLEPRKGIEDLIVAARRFLRGRPKASLTVVGSPSEAAPPGYQASLRAAARASGVMDRIAFPGWRSDSGAVLAEFDVVCVPSHAEPFGTVAAEAAAHGVPVVATDVGGLSEVVVDGETGVLVPPRNPAALAAAIAPLLDDRETRARMGARARERALARFAPGPYADRVDALLRDAVGR